MPTGLSRTRARLLGTGAFVASLVLGALVVPAVDAPVASASVADTFHEMPGGDMRGTGGVITLCNDPIGFRCTGAGYDGQADQIRGLGWSPSLYWSYGTPGPDGSRHNCTTYAAYRLQQAGYAFPGWTANASGWATEARAHGVIVNQTPAVGAIAQWNAGHVGYVQAVLPDAVVISSDDYRGGTDTEEIPLWSPWRPDNYLHFKDVSTSVVAAIDTASVLHVFTATAHGVLETYWGGAGVGKHTDVVSTRPTTAVAALGSASGSLQVISATSAGTFDTSWTPGRSAHKLTSRLNWLTGTAIATVTTRATEHVVVATVHGVDDTFWDVAKPNERTTIRLNSLVADSVAAAARPNGSLVVFTSTATGLYETTWHRTRPSLVTVRVNAESGDDVTALVTHAGALEVFAATPAGVWQTSWSVSGRLRETRVINRLDATSVSALVAPTGSIHVFTATPTGTFETYGSSPTRLTHTDDVNAVTSASVAAVIASHDDFHVVTATATRVLETYWGPGLGARKHTDVVTPV